MTMWSPRIQETSGPRYLAIADAIERDVGSGMLPEGTQLPTHRELAQHLGVTVGTVTRGYAEAERRGLTVGEVGRGTFVRTRRHPEDFGWREAARPDEADLMDLSLACPWIPPDGSDGRELGAALTELTRGGPLDQLLAYHPATATSRQRAVGATFIGTLGHEVSPEQVVVTSGAQHAMGVVLASFMAPGDVLATAELTYPGLRAIARMSAVRLRGIELDEEGIVPEALDAACEAAPITAVYCVPTIQNPTGATMSEGRRRAIADVAERRGLLVLEDEVCVLARGDVPRPIASFAPDRTFLITTLSKSVSFGLRVGFVAAPERAVERIRSGVRSSLWQTAPLMTEIATRWISDGTADRIARRKVAELEARHRIAHEVFRGDFVVQTNPHALHLWVHLPDPLRSDECVAQARQRGVLIAGAEAFAVGRDVPPAVRVAIAPAPRREDLRRALEIVRAVAAGCSDPYVQIL